VNAYIKHYHSDSSANVQNRKVSFLKKLFSYAVDESLMFDNPATRKKMRRTEEKKRQRLSLITLKPFGGPLNLVTTAMDLALQTTHARLEVSRIRYSIKEPRMESAAVYGSISQKTGFMARCTSTAKNRRKRLHMSQSRSGRIETDDESRDNVASPLCCSPDS
jgi:hypothetical protein